MSEPDIAALVARLTKLADKAEAHGSLTGKFVLLDTVHDTARALRDAAAALERQPPTDADEPPGAGWYSCPRCYGWFKGEPVAFDSGEEVCPRCVERDAAVESGCELAKNILTCDYDIHGQIVTLERMATAFLTTLGEEKQ